jgi:predicted DNA-binding protein
MPEQNIHEYHFIMDREMKEKLTNLNLFNGVCGLSGIIDRILQILVPVIEGEHKWGEQRCSRYMNVCADPEVVREHVHAYIPVEMYRRLKLLHQDLNVFSIAQMMREFLGWFLEFVEEYKGDVLRELKRIFTLWSEDKKLTRLTLREYLRQLLRILQHLPGKNRLINIYNRDFSPFWIFRL